MPYSREYPVRRMRLPSMKAVVQAGLLRHAEPGRARAIQAHAAQFNWDRTADAYLALYRRLLKLPQA